MTARFSPEDFMATAPRSLDGNTAWASRYARELRGVITRQATLAPRSQQVHLGPSEIGVACGRQVAGKLAGLPKTNNVSDPWPSIVGTAVHAWLAAAFTDDNAREQVLRWAAEVRVTPHPAHAGTADLYDAWEAAVVDHKVLGATSLAKVKSPRGPSRKYRVQLILYGLGFRALGLPVRRVVLAAYPRTAATLDGMYVWEQELGPEQEELAASVLERTSVLRLLAAEIAAGRMSFMQVPASPDDEECFWCFGGNTEIVTRQGIKPIRELAGTTPELLVPSFTQTGKLGKRGHFQEAPVRYLGDQATYLVTLEDRRARKEVTATGEHRWIVTDRVRQARSGMQVIRHQWQKTTLELRPGDLLQPLLAAGNKEPGLMRVAAAQGFVFGDGSAENDERRPAIVDVYGPDKTSAMLSFFPGAHRQYEGANGTPYTHVANLPRFWKDLPPVSESRPFLLSWLAGYFAADGHASSTGQCTISSARERNLLFVRDLAAVCGIGYRPITKTSRTGINATQATSLFELALQRRDLPSWFFLREDHRQRADAANEKRERETYWKVVSVRPTGIVEPVYCATVDGAGAFGLADSIAVMNCPFYRPQQRFDSMGGCPGTTGAGMRAG